MCIFSNFAGQHFDGTVLGHEVAGVVDALGSELDPATSPVKVGDRVLLYPWMGCRNCCDCDKGYNNLCEYNMFGSMDLGLGANSGGYSSHVVVPDTKFAVKVPDNVSLEAASMLPCSGITAYWAVLKALPFLEQAKERRGEAKVLVNGAGGLGLWAISTLAATFENDPTVKIFATDIGEDKLLLAKEKGATDTVLLERDASPSDKAAVLVSEAKSKFNVVLDFVAAEPTVNMAMQVVAKWGALAVVGMGGGKLAYPLIPLTYNTLTVYGTRTGPLNVTTKLLDLVSTKGIKTPSVEYFKLSDVNTALDKLRKGQIRGRAVIKY